MRHFPLRELGYAIGFIVLLAALYVGSYYAMARRVTDEGCWVRYAFLDDWALSLFSPIHTVDRQIRPEFWEDERFTELSAF